MPLALLVFTFHIVGYYSVAFLLSGLLSWGLVGLLVRWAPQFGLVDRPNERSSHTRVTPRGGGIGFVLTMLLLGSGGLFWRDSATPLVWLTYLGTGLFIAAISLWDDFHSLGAGIRFLCHFAAAGLVLWQVGGFHVFDVPGLGSWQLGILGVGLSVLWIVGLTNVYNFMDGIDGIAGLQGAVAGVAWALAGAWLQAPWVVLLGALLAGSCTGFLVHNWSPAKIFMGDVGSAFLGFSFGVLPLLAVSSIHNSGEAPVGRLPVFAVMVVWPFIGDGLLTFFRRVCKREKVWVAHRSHLYQRLIQCGWSHTRVTLLYGLWAVISSGIGLVYLRGNGCWTECTPFAFAALSLLAMFAFVRKVECP